MRNEKGEEREEEKGMVIECKKRMERQGRKERERNGEWCGVARGAERKSMTLFWNSLELNCGHSTFPSP